MDIIARLEQTRQDTLRCFDLSDSQLGPRCAAVLATSKIGFVRQIHFRPGRPSPPPLGFVFAFLPSRREPPSPTRCVSLIRIVPASSFQSAICGRPENYHTFPNMRHPPRPPRPCPVHIPPHPDF